MATLAAENEESRESADQAPISTHSAFPAIVALWFAALLGLGSLILPVLLLERLASATGIAALIPSAPPLGFTARATISLAVAILGAVLGLLLARQVAGNQAPRPRPRFGSGDVRRCKPISAHDELSEGGIGSVRPRASGTERRSLAFDPLPQPESGFESESGSADALPFSPPSLRRMPAPAPAAGGSDEAAGAALSARPTQAEPLIPLTFEPELQAAPQLAVVDTGQDDDLDRSESTGRGIPLEEVGLVQLATRLGDAIERRRALRAERSGAAPARPEFAASEDFDAAEAEEAAVARADFFGEQRPAEHESRERELRAALETLQRMSGAA